MTCFMILWHSVRCYCGNSFPGILLRGGGGGGDGENVAENFFSASQNCIVFMCCACIPCSLLDSPKCLLLYCMQ